MAIQRKKAVYAHFQFQQSKLSLSGCYQVLQTYRPIFLLEEGKKQLVWHCCAPQMAVDYQIAENREGMLGMALIFYCYVTIPSVLDYQAVTSNDFFAKWIELVRKADGESAAFPSFHVFWALNCYRHTVLQFSRLKRPLAVLAWAIVVSCLTTHNHTLLEWGDLFCDHTFFMVLIFLIVTSVFPV